MPQEMPPEKEKLRSGKPPVGKCTTLATTAKGKATEPTPTPSSAPVQSAGVVTYKRKKVDNKTCNSNQETKRLKIGPFAALQDDEYDEWQRVRNHLQETIKSIVEPKYVNGTCPDKFWLSVSKGWDDSPGLQLVLTEQWENKDGNENPQNSPSEAGDGYHSKKISLGTDNRLKEILSGLDTASRPAQYQIPLGTATGKLEGVLYDILTSGKFGLLCDMICENFQTTKDGQPVKMDFIVSFSSILSKVRKGSYDQSPELFEQDIQMILKKFMIIGREMSALAYGLAALTKYHCQKLIDDASVGSSAKKNGRDERISDKSMSSFQANNQQTGDSEVGASADKCDTSREYHENATSSSQLNNQQIGGSGCGLAEGKCNLGEHKIDCSNALLRFLTRQLDDLGYHNAGETMVENTSSLNPASQQIGYAACNSAAERTDTLGTNIAKITGSFDNICEKSTSICAAMEVDVNSCAATMDSMCAAFVGNSCESVPILSQASPVPKSDQTDPSWQHKKDICKRCGTEADGNKSLICDGCEAMYHITCTEPVTQESPVRSWYCTQCSGKNDCEEVNVSNDQHDCLHEGCVVCERLKSSECLEDRLGNTENFATVELHRKREHSLICEENGDTDTESPEPSRTAVLHLCKRCGTREEEDKKFLTCSHRTCHFKYYHVNCLNAAQLAINRQPEGLWYCPSCLCRTCLTDKDDHLVCLCDRCDEAYHTYCMDPPRKAIPKGIWCCTSCNKERIKEGMKKFEERILAMQVTRNRAAKQSERHISKKNVKVELEEYCERAESNRGGDRKLNQPQPAKEVNTEQFKKQLELVSPSSQHKTVQHRQLKLNAPKMADTQQLKKQLQHGSPSSHPKTVQQRQLKQNDVKRQQKIDNLNNQPEKNSVNKQLMNDTQKCRRKRSSVNGDGNSRSKKQRSHLNGKVTMMDKQKGCSVDRSFKTRYGRNEVEGQYINGDIVKVPAEKQVERLPCRQLRVGSPERTEHQINGDLNEQCERIVRFQQRNGSKELTDKMDVEHSLGSIGVLLDALDASEKMDKEAHKSAANGKKR